MLAIVTLVGSDQLRVGCRHITHWQPRKGEQDGGLPDYTVFIIGYGQSDGTGRIGTGFYV